MRYPPRIVPRAYQTVITSSWGVYLCRAGRSQWTTWSERPLASLCPQHSVLTLSPLPELKIRLETASTLSVPDQLRRMYPHGRSLWTILALIYTATDPSGQIIPILLVTTEELCRIQRVKARLFIPLMGSQYGMIMYLIPYNDRPVT